MKQLIWKLVMPLTVISLATFTKWWYVLPVDAPGTMMSGFPFAFVSEGWHTSMSLQVFVAEFTVDLLTYFFCWFLFIFICNHYLIKIEVPKILAVTLLTLTGFVITVTIIVVSMPEHVFKVKRDFDMEVISTGYKFIWQHQDHSDLSEYALRKKSSGRR